MDAEADMGVYLTPDFDKERRRLGITDKIICKTARKVFSGLRGNQLGKFTYKRRIALPKVSERDGARSIIFFNDGKHLYFFYLYAKSSLAKKKRKAKRLKMQKQTFFVILRRIL
ncbi:type II toxin-antitoxin system RelE/ParE family toxin [Candidatus Pantoea persica]|uniref:type II toxin-antitoxin system RelE/ParE family toxin n=1 Tax=Candidatus Pantoea persica TaxID=2518128 RepID=UPI00215D69A7|nr:type II toxin-antitoxin system RelE/ParE family toxin [Candidatus Pantoea persica]